MTLKLVLGYRAAAKGNTLLNFAGVKSDLLSGIADKASSKQGKFTPGSHIPIIKPELIDELDPDYILFALEFKEGNIRVISFLSDRHSNSFSKYYQ